MHKDLKSTLSNCGDRLLLIGIARKLCWLSSGKDWPKLFSLRRAKPQAPPTEILRKKTILLTPFASKSLESTQRDLLSAAVHKLKTESEKVVTDPLTLFALGTSISDSPYAPVDSADLSRRVEVLSASCSDTLVFGYNEFYRMTSFVSRYTQGSSALCY